MSPSQSNLHPGACEHYEDAESYDTRYQGRSEDVEFYLSKISPKSSVLEYGAGAGRLTIPLAEQGAHVTAVDASSPMISLLERKLSLLESKTRRRVSVKKADMRHFTSRKRYDFVIAAFHTACHLYSVADASEFFSHAWRHLKPGGRLLFDLPLPRIDMPGYDPISQVRVTEMDAPQGPQLLTQRWFQPQEVLMHLHYAGFRNARLGADFDSSLPDRETSVFTVSATRPRTK